MSSSSSSSGSERGSPAPVVSKKRMRPEPKEDAESSASGSESEADDDVPALSHAEKRKQRRKEKEAAKQALKDEDDEPAAKKLKGKDGKPVVATGKRQNSVWVGNLSYQTTVESLREFFDGCGEITRVNLPTKPGPGAQNRGFAYVDFASPDAKVIGISMSEKNLHGRRLLIKDGNDYEGRPGPIGLDGKPMDAAKTAATTVGLSKTAQKILRAQKQPPAPTLFIGNLGFEATEKSIRELFEAHRPVRKLAKKPKEKRVPKEKKKKADNESDESSDSESEVEEVEADSDRDSDVERIVADAVGEEEKPGEEKKPHVQDIWIRKIRMGTFEDSGLCKGWAFVDFGSIEHATAVLLNPKNHLLDGRALKVEYASADAVRRGGGGPRIEGAVRGRAAFRGLGRGGRRGGAVGGAPTGGDIPRAQARTPHRWGDDLESAPPVAEYGEAKWPSVQQRTEAADQTAGRPLNKAGKVKGPQFRPKPGAALALAKRESAAIVPNQGQKTKF